ncbi:hypothetical protein ACPVPU_13125 [Sphingomonas sp. CJ99]
MLSIPHARFKSDIRPIGTGFRPANRSEGLTHAQRSVGHPSALLHRGVEHSINADPADPAFSIPPHAIKEIPPWQKANNAEIAKRENLKSRNRQNRMRQIHR